VDIDAAPDLLLLIQQKLCLVPYRCGSLFQKILPPVCAMLTLLRHQGSSTVKGLASKGEGERRERRKGEKNEGGKEREGPPPPFPKFLDPPMIMGPICINDLHSMKR